MGRRFLELHEYRQLEQHPDLKGLKAAHDWDLEVINRLAGHEMSIWATDTLNYLWDAYWQTRETIRETEGETTHAIDLIIERVERAIAEISPYKGLGG